MTESEAAYASPTSAEMPPLAVASDEQITPLRLRCGDCYEFGHEECGCGECGLPTCGQQEPEFVVTVHVTPDQTQALVDAWAACRWCGDEAVVFVNRSGGHCAECYREGREAERLHEAGA